MIVVPIGALDSGTSTETERGSIGSRLVAGKHDLPQRSKTATFPSEGASHRRKVIVV